MGSNPTFRIVGYAVRKSHSWSIGPDLSVVIDYFLLRSECNIIYTNSILIEYLTTQYVKCSIYEILALKIWIR